MHELLLVLYIIKQYMCKCHVFLSRLQEVKGMANRIKLMRQMLVDGLKKEGMGHGAWGMGC